MQAVSPMSDISVFYPAGSGDSGLSSPLTFVASPTSPGGPDLCDPSLTYIERVVAEYKLSVDIIVQSFCCPFFAQH